MSRQNGTPIQIGYAWTQRVAVTSTTPAFPVGCTLQGQFRASRNSETVLADLTTANGGLTRISDTEIDIFLTDAQTASMAVGTVSFDMIRTDVAPPAHLGFYLVIPTLKPITRV